MKYLAFGGLFVSLLQPLVVIAQTQLSNDIRRYEDIIGSNYMSAQFDNRYEGIKGSPFLFDVWTTGRIVDSKGQEYQNLSVKYDAYKNEILVNTQSRGTFYLNKNFAKAFYMKDPSTAKWLKFIPITVPDDQQETPYYLELFSGKTTLLEQFHITLIKADFQGAYSQDRRYDEFQKSSVFYLKGPNDTLTKIKTTRNGLAKSFPNHNDEIKNYIRANNINPDDRNDLTKVVEYYDSL